MTYAARTAAVPSPNERLVLDQGQETAEMIAIDVADGPCNKNTLLASRKRHFISVAEESFLPCTEEQRNAGLIEA